MTSAVVSSSEEAKIFIALRKGDFDFINKTGKSFSVYWFIDCRIVHKSNSFELNYNFKKPPNSYTIEALAVVSYNSSAVTIHTQSKIKSNTSTKIKGDSNKKMALSSDIEMPYVCNSTKKAKHNVTYGYFYRKIVIKGK